MNRWHQIVPKLVMIVPVLMLAACSATTTAPSPPKIDSYPRVASESVLPFERSILGADDQDQLKSAYKKLVQECASEFGVTLQLVADQPMEREARFQMWDGRFGTMTLEHAKQFGYHAGPGDPVAKSFQIFVDDATEPRASVLRGPSKDTSADLLDKKGRPVPKGGCTAKIQSSIGGDSYNLAPESSEKYRMLSFSDPRTKKALRNWTKCMKGLGYTYATVDAPVDQIAGSPLTRKETEIASADVECTAQSRWRDISFAVQAVYEQRVVSANPDRFASALKSQQQMLKRALQLVAARGL